MSTHNPKEAAGRAAAALVEDGMALGLGTGSTVWFTLVALAERIAGEGLAVRGVPTSLDTERKAQELGIPLATLDDLERLDLCIDGADEADGSFHLTKGGGGALLREKVVAHASTRRAIVLTAGKLVERLGDTFPLPVEVVPFALAPVARELSRLGCEPLERRADGGETYRTDNGNAILDCRFAGGLEDPREAERAIGRIPGVVESGLFIDLADVLVIGDAAGGAELRERS